MSELQVIEAGAVKFVDEVKAEVEKAVEAVKPEVKKALVAISADEKLILAEAEVEYLKATMEIQRLTKITEAKAKEYQTAVDGFLTKYGLSKAEYLFDGVKKAFTLIEKKL
jgi:uncharacterized protein YeeX (DUF496 family)